VHVTDKIQRINQRQWYRWLR